MLEEQSCRVAASFNSFFLKLSHQKKPDHYVNFFRGKGKFERTKELAHYGISEEIPCFKIMRNYVSHKD
jgi:hypothetical protein